MKSTNADKYTFNYSCCNASFWQSVFLVNMEAVWLFWSGLWPRRDIQRHAVRGCSWLMSQLSIHDGYLGAVCSYMPVLWVCISVTSFCLSEDASGEIEEKDKERLIYLSNIKHKTMLYHHLLLSGMLGTQAIRVIQTVKYPVTNWPIKFEYGN